MMSEKASMNADLHTTLPLRRQNYLSKAWGFKKREDKKRNKDHGLLSCLKHPQKHKYSSS